TDIKCTKGDDSSRCWQLISSKDAWNRLLAFEIYTE
ncbi:MAG: hypothetical protein ACI909_002546, partial [Planctomycetota bacterium]